MNTIEFIVLMISTIIIVALLCSTWMASNKDNKDGFKISAKFTKETIDKLADKYHTCIDIDPNGKIHYFFGSARKNNPVELPKEEE